MRVKNMSIIEYYKRQIIKFEKKHRLIKNANKHTIIRLYSQEIIKYAFFEPHPQYAYVDGDDSLIFSLSLKPSSHEGRMFVWIVSDKQLKQLFVKKSLQTTIELAAEIVIALENHNFSLKDLLLANKFKKTNLFAGGLT